MPPAPPASFLIAPSITYGNRVNQTSFVETKAAETDWCRVSVADVLAELGTDPASGLTTPEAGSRLTRHGRNELVDRGARSPWSILWSSSRRSWC